MCQIDVERLSFNRYKTLSIRTKTCFFGMYLYVGKNHLKNVLGSKSKFNLFQLHSGMTQWKIYGHVNIISSGDILFDVIDLK